MIAFEKVGRLVRGKALVRGIQGALVPGTLTALIGPNGAGKSTLLGLAAGLQPPDEGIIRFDGRPLADWYPRELALRRACLAQQTSVAFEFSALEIVLFGRHPHHGGHESRRDRQAALAAMERAGVGHLAHRASSTLSGGEQQRVHFARCLAQLNGEDSAPRCLLLDEPVASLDLAHQHRLLETVAAECRSGLTSLLVIHDLALAARYADELWVLHEGRLVACGTPREVLTAALLEEVFAVQADIDFLDERHCHLRVHAPCAAAW